MSVVDRDSQRVNGQRSRVTDSRQMTANSQMDTDGDGVDQSRDQCPNEPEDHDHVADLDGCPEVDQDCDGIADELDTCPEHAEDRDNFQDEDGCPDPDNDGDNVVDICDLCPNEPETYNGIDDEDGCPDRSHVVVQNSAIRIMIYPLFSRNSSVIRSQTEQVLTAVRDTLQQHPELTQLAVVGHASVDESHATRLSQQRAHAVVLWLLGHGIDASRLVEQSVGAAQPIAVSTTELQRARNRRVQFVVVAVTNRAQQRWTGTEYVAVDEPSPPQPVRVQTRPVCVVAAPTPIRPGGCPLASVSRLWRVDAGAQAQ